MIKITENELFQLSELIEVPYDALSKLHSLKLLNEMFVLDILIKNDVAKVRKFGKYRPGQILAAVANKYCVPVSRVRSASYNKRDKNHYCAECGKKIKAAEYNRNEGRCDSCVVKSIEI